MDNTVRGRIDNESKRWDDVILVIRESFTEEMVFT